MAPMMLRKHISSNKSSQSEAAAHPNDVLLGRGKGSYEWQGNLRYQQIICFYLPQYSAAKKKQDKTRISNDIVEIIKKSGGRFLKEKTRGGKLCEVTDKEARVKVAQALRHRIRLCDGDKQEASFGMFSFAGLGGGNSTAVEDRLSFNHYRDVLSSRTDDTEPIVSGRTDLTRDPPSDDFGLSGDFSSSDFVTGLLGGTNNMHIHDSMNLNATSISTSYIPQACVSANQVSAVQQQFSVLPPQPPTSAGHGMVDHTRRFDDDEESEDDLDQAIAQMPDDMSISNLSSTFSSLDMGSDNGDSPISIGM